MNVQWTVWKWHQPSGWRATVCQSPKISIWPKHKIAASDLVWFQMFWARKQMFLKFVSLWRSTKFEACQTKMAELWQFFRFLAFRFMFKCQSWLFWVIIFQSGSVTPPEKITLINILLPIVHLRKNLPLSDVWMAPMALNLRGGEICPPSILTMNLSLSHEQ